MKTYDLDTWHYIGRLNNKRIWNIRKWKNGQTQIHKISRRKLAATIVFAVWKDGALRFCVDFEELNAATRWDSHPKPRTNDRIDSRGEATVLFTPSDDSGLWQVKFDEKNVQRIDFISHLGLCRFIRITFGLRNALCTFQSATNFTLSLVKL